MLGHLLRCLGLPGLLSWLRSSRRAGFLLPLLKLSGPRSCLEDCLVEIGTRTLKDDTGRLVIGVRKDDGRLLAHAWIEKEGEMFEEREGFRRLGEL